MNRIFLTGCAGFIGFHLAGELIRRGFLVHGVDAMTEYYDVRLKEDRLNILRESTEFTFTFGNIEDSAFVEATMRSFQPDCVIHLAAQAGVRYSIENPQAYIDTNIVGTFNIFKSASNCDVKHLLAASTSSVYGANVEQPFHESQRTDTPLTIYAATKKATESVGHAWANVQNLPITMFRFFTVYGPWGRPDMALFKFTKGILDGTPIDIYNNGNMFRDFTYVQDLVASITDLVSEVPSVQERERGAGDSHIAPFRVINIGNATRIRLLDFVEELEFALGITAVKNFLPIQLGDVPSTHADVAQLESLTGRKPSTPYPQGIRNFVDWYRAYYRV